jgi:hypothetical protein
VRLQPCNRLARQLLCSTSAFIGVLTHPSESQQLLPACQFKQRSHSSSQHGTHPLVCCTPANTHRCCCPAANDVQRLPAMPQAGQRSRAPRCAAAGAAAATCLPASTPWAARHVVKELLKDDKLWQQDAPHIQQDRVTWSAGGAQVLPVCTAHPAVQCDAPRSALVNTHESVLQGLGTAVTPAACKSIVARCLVCRHARGPLTLFVCGT